MRHHKAIIPFVLVYIWMPSGCAQKRPVLYPNYHLQQVGDDQAQADITECIHFAEQEGARSSPGNRVVKETAKGAAIGGAVGAAAGAVVDKTGRGAAAGAAGAGAGALVSGIFRAREPDLLFRRFVERCLSERGYEPIGWR